MRGRRRFGIGSDRRLRVLLLALVAIGSAAIGITLYTTSLLGSLEGSTINGRFSVRGTQHPPKNIVIVAIDDKTYDDLNAFPFPRTYYATLINNLAAEHPAAIVFDIDLETKSTIGRTCHVAGLTLACDDYALLNAINNHPGVTVFGSTQPTATHGQAFFLGSGAGSTLAHAVGSQLAGPHVPEQPAGECLPPDGRLDPTSSRRCTWPRRRWPTHKRITKARSSAATNGSTTREPSTRSRGSPSRASMNPQKYGPPNGWSHPLPANYFRGKIVFVGATQLSLEDFHATSTDGADGRSRDRGRR